MVLPLNWRSVFILSFLFSFILFAAEPPAVAFQKKKIQVGGKKITVEIAETPVQHERGLMHRKTLAKDSGMLFIFKTEQPLSFWMKNTYIDLSIAYFDKDKKIVDIFDMKSTTSMQVDFPSYPSSKPALYALEMNQGWFVKNKIKVGDLLILNP